MKTVVISYNSIVGGEENGWKVNGENSVLLIQNADGRIWGIDQFNINKEKSAKETEKVINLLWEQLKHALPNADKVVLYVGSHGAHTWIELAYVNGLTPDRAIFVMCHCNITKKMETLSKYGFSTSKITMCRCGGHYDMLKIYQNALNGNIPN